MEGKCSSVWKHASISHNVTYLRTCPLVNVSIPDICPALLLEVPLTTMYRLWLW